MDKQKHGFIFWILGMLIHKKGTLPLDVCIKIFKDHNIFLFIKRE